MDENLVDLHVHTTASDGSDSPGEVVRKAAALRLAALAVTDHDTLDGLEEAETEARAAGLELIRGCEISTRSPFGEVHVLGLWLPSDPALLRPLKEALGGVRQGRITRNQRILDNLLALGLPVPRAEILKLAEKGVPGRPHIAEALCRLGIAANHREAFRKYLGVNGLAYAPRELMEPEQAVRLLAATGATVCWAHPCLNHAPPQELEAMLIRLVPLGLTALEAYHSEHTARDERLCVELADRYGLQISGGSDYHGRLKPEVALGRGKGGLRVRKHILDKLKAARGTSHRDC
jgi:predicted metal-dependent phosphoesterase TrpH